MAKKKGGAYLAPKKKRKLGTILFYSVYVLLIALALVGIFHLLGMLESWLEKYEASQPEKTGQEIFRQYFAQPDWERLYTMAGEADTRYETAKEYAAYMEEAAQGKQLTYSETSAGLSGNRKYIVRLEGKRVASFLMEPSDGADGITHWALGEVELFYQRQQGVTVEKLPEHTVYVNGVALDESFTVRCDSTAAEDYLPEGVHGWRREWQYVDGLLVQPQITVLDENGVEIPVEQRPDGVFAAKVAAPAEMTEQERELILNAAKTNALYAIRAVDSGELKRYFDPQSEVYERIRKTEVFLRDYVNYGFLEESTAVTDFLRYSDGSFSARVALELNVRRESGFSKSYGSNSTYFFTCGEDGVYRVDRMTNASVAQNRSQVRVTFVQDGQQVHTQLVDTAGETMPLPQITVPEGKVLQGWAKQEKDEKGNISMTVLFLPGETAPLKGEEALEPMTLYAVYQNAE